MSEPSKKNRVVAGIYFGLGALFCIFAWNFLGRNNGVIAGHVFSLFFGFCALCFFWSALQSLLVGDDSDFIREVRLLDHAPTPTPVPTREQATAPAREQSPATVKIPLPATTKEASAPADPGSWTRVQIRPPSMHELSRMLRVEINEYDKQARKFQAMMTSGLVMAVVCGILAFALDRWDAVQIVSGALAAIGVLMLIAGQRSRAAAFKKILLKKIVKLLSPTLQFSGTGISPNAVKASRLVHGYNSLRSEDLVTGRLYGQLISFAEVKAERVQKYGSGRNRRRRTTVVWHGVFGEIKLPVQIAGRLSVMPDSEKENFSSLLNLIGKKVGLNTSELVRVSDADFERRFSVFVQGNDSVTQLLHQDFTRYLTDSAARLRDVRISFAGNSLYFGIRTDQTYLEPGKNPAESVQRAAIQLSLVLEFAANIIGLIGTHSASARRSA